MENIMEKNSALRWKKFLRFCIFNAFFHVFFPPFYSPRNPYIWNYKNNKSDSRY